MLLELARPVTLLGSILSLLIVFHTAFFGSETDFRQRIYDSLGMLMMAAAFSALSGLTFRGAGGEPSSESVRASYRLRLRELSYDAPQEILWQRRAKLRLVANHGKMLVSPRRELALLETLPMQLFFWSTAIMTALFLLSWFFETCVMPYSSR